MSKRYDKAEPVSDEFLAGVIAGLGIAWQVQTRRAIDEISDELRQGRALVVKGAGQTVALKRDCAEMESVAS